MQAQKRNNVHPHSLSDLLYYVRISDAVSNFKNIANIYNTEAK